jgi:hypothetical protein
VQLIRALKGFINSINKVTIQLVPHERGFMVKDVLLPVSKISEKNLMNLQPENPLW